MDRSRSQPGIDMHVDRIADDLQKNGNSEESHELERAGHQNSGSWGDMPPAPMGEVYRP